MARKKKFIIIGLVLAVIVVLGAIGGIALADNATSPTTVNPLIAKVATILGIDQAKVQAAFDQAQQELQSEALNARLAQMVTDGKITQSQADAYKAWMEAKPAGIDQLGPGPGMMGRGFGGGRGGCGGFGGVSVPQTSTTTN